MTGGTGPVRLPPERHWPDLSDRADRVIAEVAREQRRTRRRTGLLVPALTAAALAVVVALGIGLLTRPPEAPVVGTPPGPATSTVPVPEPSRGDRLRLLAVGETARLRHTDVTVAEFARIGRGVAVRVKTCVVDAPPDRFPNGVEVRISDWIAIRDGHSGVAAVRSGPGGRSPVHPDAARLTEGECVAGWIPPLNPPGEGRLRLVHLGESGEHIWWALE